MKTLKLELDNKQIINLFRQLDETEKVVILNELKQSTFKRRMDNLLQSLKTDSLTMEEITQEVELVRQKRYEERQKKS